MVHLSPRCIPFASVLQFVPCRQTAGCEQGYQYLLSRSLGALKFWPPARVVLRHSPSTFLWAHTFLSTPTSDLSLIATCTELTRTTEIRTDEAWKATYQPLHAWGVLLQCARQWSATGIHDSGVRLNARGRCTSDLHAGSRFWIRRKHGERRGWSLAWRHRRG